MHRTKLHFTAINITALNCTKLYSTTPHCTLLHQNTPHYSTLHYTAPQYTTLNYTAPQYPTLHYTKLHSRINRTGRVRPLSPTIGTGLTFPELLIGFIGYRRVEGNPGRVVNGSTIYCSLETLETSPPGSVPCVNCVNWKL